jgi:uncharacterized protein
MTPVFIDANIQTYSAGRDHPMRESSRQILALVADNPDAFVTDAEVLQELLHRYLALRYWPAGRHSIEEFAYLMTGHIEPMLAVDVARATQLADSYPGLSARDLVHAAVMFRLGSSRIATADTGFDLIKGIERLDPMKVNEWRDTVTA